MKKFLSILMALLLVATLGITALATENTGSITITNATKDQTYTVYKLFDASYDAAAASVSYAISPSDQFYGVFFNADGTATADNVYFVFNKNTSSVTKADGANDADLIAYLTGIVTADGASFSSAASAVAATQTVTFSDLPYGYYVIVSSMGAAVTITGNAPDVEVIDKNQAPGAGFQKKVWDEITGTWADSNAANVGDLVKYQISFAATNYDGEEQVQYYTIHDIKGDAIWAEFGNASDSTYDISVSVGAVKLDRGYYLPLGDIAPADPAEWEWEYLGDWGTTEKARDNAQWYLVHVGEDEFRITIPWLSAHSVIGTQENGYDLDFSSTESLYASPSEVVVEYWATVEPNAEVGGGSDTNLFNTAYAEWTYSGKTSSTDRDTVYTEVFGLGVLKTDADTGSALGGAKFEIFTDADCTAPLYVIPTDIEGVYVKDDLYSDAQTVTGENKLTARELYAANLDAYLNGATQKNEVVSPVNGKIVILGLDKGTYYIKETKAPAGYNALTAPISVEAGIGTADFCVYADADGKVANIDVADAAYAENAFNVTKTVIENSRGVALPTTGGQGTFWLITIGTLLAIGFGVFLITHKKMSVYTD